MIVAVCADKGSPGVTTLATVLGLVWPGERVVLEADPSGGDLPFRLLAPGGDAMRAEPSVLSLAADARTGLTAPLSGYAQLTAVGVPVIPGALSVEAYMPMRSLWPQVATEAARWSGVVIADVGRTHPGNAALAVARAATCVLLIARPTVEGLYHLRERVTELARVLGDPARQHSPLAVVVLAPHRQRREAVSQVEAVLQAAGSPIPVLGVLAEDPAGEQALRTAAPGRRLAKSALVRSGRDLVQQVLARWPQLLPDQATLPDSPGPPRAPGPLGAQAAAGAQPAGAVPGPDGASGAGT